jgi:thiamine biosynthesis lipoprotein
MTAAATVGLPPDPVHAPDVPDRVVGFASRALGSNLGLHVRLPATGTPAGDAAGRASASLAWERVRTEFDEVDRALSRFREDSELTALNRLSGSGRVAVVSWRLRTMLAAVHRAGRLTGGRFDASVLADLERLGERGARLAGAAVRAATDGVAGDGAAAPTPAGAVRLVSAGAPRASHVRVPEVPVDSGGIGKGLALRWAAASAVQALPVGAGILLDAGGDLFSAGAAPPGGWRVGIEDPAGADRDAEPLAVVAVERGAVATSSVRVRNWVGPDGRQVHHLLDPRTGEPARTGLVAVTVAGIDPAWSEVWSKVLFLAGRHAIGVEARSRGLAAWWVDDRGHLGMTPAARQCSEWISEARAV